MPDIKEIEQDPILKMLELMGEQLEENGNCDHSLLAAFAVYLGWKEVEKHSITTWRGYAPEGRKTKHSRRFRPELKASPTRFFSTYQDVLDLIPDKCVESYHAAFDGSYYATISPQGDLGLQFTCHRSDDLIKAMGGAILKMRYSMRHKQLSDIN